MKLWYFENSKEQESLLAYGSTPEDALQRYIKSRMDKNNDNYDYYCLKVKGKLGYWNICREFTENYYDGCLNFWSVAR